jgi:DNA-binding HxlR family transcriptional regulator
VKKASDGTVKLKYLTKRTGPDGTVRWYLRRGKSKFVRIHGKDPTDPVFLAAYAAAMLAAPDGAKSPTRHATGSLGAACEVALASDRYHASGKATRAMFKRHLSVIAEKYGKAPLVEIQPPHIRKSVSEANAKGHRLRTWRFLFSVLLELGLVDSNPAALVKMPKGPPPVPHPPWEAEDIAKRLQDQGDAGSLVKQGALYPVLRTLSAAGLLASRVVPSYAGPPRRYYRITPAGRATLGQWLGIWRHTRDLVNELTDTTGEEP